MNTKNIIDEINLLPKNIILNYNNTPISFYMLLHSNYTTKKYHIFTDTCKKNSYNIIIEKTFELDKKYENKIYLYSFDILSIKKFIYDTSTFYDKYITGIHIFIINTDNNYILENAFSLKKLGIYKEHNDTMFNKKIMTNEMMDSYFNIQPSMYYK